MTLIDSLDSILMLYSYSGFPDRSFAILKRRKSPQDSPSDSESPAQLASQARTEESSSPLHEETEDASHHEPSRVPSRLSGIVKAKVLEEDDEDFARNLRVKVNMMSGLSIILTLLSILVAFR
jgi:nickel/cobalt transporter (NiCoT) family protein